MHVHAKIQQACNKNKLMLREIKLLTNVYSIEYISVLV